MTYAAHHQDFAPYVGGKTTPRRGAAVKKTGLLRRVIDAISQSRQRRADREIARFLARSGGRLTDDLERRMTQYLTTSNWNDWRF
jgi:hypothetical protein